MTIKPEIDNAPGLSWRPLVRDRWMASWKCRADIAKEFSPRRRWLWSGTVPTAQEVILIQDRCEHLQNEMLMFARGGLKDRATFDGSTIRSLISCYQTDIDSPYHKLRYRSREHYDALCRRVEKDVTEPLTELKARVFNRLYAQWAAGGKITMAHHCITMLRILVNFGATYLENAECERLTVALHRMKFKQGKPREERLTSAQVIALREMAHEHNRASMALAQAFQFECMLRQKDVIGEWVPMSEPQFSTVHDAGMKWLRGIRWEEIDANLVLHHETSKREKMLDVPLTKAGMVMEEFDRQFPHFKTMGRAALPASGPIIVSEYNQLPWIDEEFRRQWRKLATLAGIPKAVRNMDSRAGAITEATEAGAELEHVKHAATHGDIAMTQRYSRGAADKIAGVMDLRAAHRNKTGNPK